MMTRWMQCAAVGLACGVTGGAAAHAQHGYGDLVRRIPDGANVLVLVNVDQLHASPLGRQEGWEKNHLARFQSGLTLVPPGATRFVGAAEFDLEFLQPRWQVALCDLNDEPDLARLAAAMDGEMDNLGGLSAARLPGDLFAVKFGVRLAAIVSPANRQTVARWIQQVHDSRAGQLSPYLTEAVEFAERGAPLIMALDLENAFSPEEVRAGLAASPILKAAADPPDLDALSESLASVRGLSLGITVRDRRFGKLKLDFARPVVLDADLAHALLLEALGRRGLMIEEFRTWTCRVEGPQITLEGELGQSGAQRILSLLDAPPELRAAALAQPPEGDEEAQRRLTLQATKQYFESVVALLEDLDSKHPQTMGQAAQWHERYARKINDLPLLHVDPEMLDFGAYVSDMLRQSQNELQAVGVRSRVGQMAVPQTTTQYYSAGVATRWGAYGGYAVVETPDLRLQGQEQAKVRMTEQMRGAASAGYILQTLEQDLAQMRRLMTEKYQVEF